MQCNCIEPKINILSLDTQVHRAPTLANKLVGRLWIFLEFRHLSPTLTAAHKRWQTFRLETQGAAYSNKFSAASKFTLVACSEKYETDLMEKLFQNGEHSKLKMRIILSNMY